MKQPSGEPQFFSAIVDSMPTALLVCDPRSCITVCNPAAAKVFGRSSTQIVGQMLSMVIPDEEIWQRLKQIEPSTEHVPIQTLGLSASGDRIPLMVSASPIQTGEQNCLAITLAPDSGLMSVVERSHCEIFIFSSESLTVQYANKSARRNLGYSREQLARLSPLDFFPAFNADEFRALLEQLSSGAQEFVLADAEMQRSDGTTYRVDVELRRMQYNGQPCYAAIVMDLSERRVAEATLRGVFDNSRTFIGLMSTDGVLVDCNRTSLAASGADAEDALNKPFWDTPWWSHSEQMQTRLKQAVELAASGKRDGFEATHPTPSGEVIDVDFAISPIVSDGKVIYLVPEGLDITERKKRERETESYLAQLEESNERLEQFTYVASHDIRSPLAGIAKLVGFVEEDEAENLAPDSIRCLQTIRNRIQRLQAMLDGLLTYSRIGQARESEPQLVDTHAMLIEIIDLLQVPEGFQITIAPGMPVFQSVLSPLNQVFLNLINNAIKHSERLTGHIQISCGELGDFYEFQVADDGPGIPEADRELIFAMFKTLKTGSTAKGSGMGLAIVRRVIEHYGGAIRVESSSGGGATFCFTWPKTMA